MIHPIERLKGLENERRGKFLTIFLCFLIVSLLSTLVVNYFYPMMKGFVSKKTSNSIMVEKINILERSPFAKESAFLYRTTGIEYDYIFPIIVVILLGSILLTYFLCKFYVQHVIRTPMNRLVVAIKMAEQGNYALKSNELCEKHIPKEMIQLEQTLHNMINSVQRREQELLEHALTDILTGIPNRRAIDDYYEKCWDNGVENEMPLSVMLIDIDHFKEMNDKFGHQYGDDQLKEIAHQIKRTIGLDNSMVGRYGGDEFVAIIPNKSQNQVTRIAERVRASIEQMKILYSEDNYSSLTISIGVATVHPQKVGGQISLMALAD